MAAIFMLPLLLLVSGGLQMQAFAYTPDSGMTSMDKNNCLSLCTSRLNSPDALLNIREEEKDQEPKPRPSEQYYVQFATLASADEHIGNDYLLEYLSWRPPDLFKLYANYRM
mgnify:CR=1 FL=1